MLGPRWRLVFANLWGSKVRSALMVLTIAVGIFAVGFITVIGDLSLADMDADFAAANGHAAILSCDPFDDDLLDALRAVPGVAEVEGRSAVVARAVIGEDEKPPIQIVAIPPLEEMQIDRLSPVGAPALLPLQDHEIYLADSALGVLSASPGGTVTVELASGRRRTLRVTAIAHDVYAIPASFGSAILAYTNPSTLEWLGGPLDFNQVYLTVREQRTDAAHVNQVSQAVADQIEAGGRTVYSTFVYNPGRHFAKDIFQAVTAILAILGVLVVFLSTFLIVNSITALVNQHIRFIGVMKAIGGRQRQIAAVYLGLVLLMGVAALLLTLWTSAWAGYIVTREMGAWLNYVVRPFRYSGLAINLQVGIALLVPTLAALVPVFNGTRLTVREAVYTYGLGGRSGSRTRPNRVDLLVEKMGFLSRPALISLSNTFRRKARLVLTLSTLTLGGAVFIAVFNLWAAFGLLIGEIQGYFLADINVQLSRPYRLQELQAMIEPLPGIAGVEGWGHHNAELLSTAGGAPLSIAIVSPPGDSQLIRPILTAGRWLRPDDQNALVIGNHVLKERPDLGVGDTVITRIDEKDYTWMVVGAYKMGGNAVPPMVYANDEYVSHLINQTGRVTSLRVITAAHTGTAQASLANTLEALFKARGVQVAQVQQGLVWAKQQGSQFDVMIYFLLVMAILIAVVGGLGLMGTMSMNVLERSREIGVLRAIGASNAAILKMVLGEGLFIGAISWVLSLLLSLPLTTVLNNQVGASIMTTPMDFTFNPSGAVLWLGFVLGLAALASLLPAWNAMRLTIRAVLAYE